MMLFSQLNFLNGKKKWFSTDHQSFFRSTSPQALKLDNHRRMLLSSYSSLFQLHTGSIAQLMLTRIGKLRNNGFVLTWWSMQDIIGDPNGNIYGQIFSETSTSGNEFQVNIPDQQKASSYPDVVELRDGSYIITYSGLSQDMSAVNVYVVRFLVDSHSLLQVNTHNDLTACYAGAAIALDNGGFVIIWSAATTGSSLNIYGRQYSAAAYPVGQEFQINDPLAGDHYLPAATTLNNQELLIVWQYNKNIYGKYYSSSCVSIGPAFQISNSTNSNSYNNAPAVAGLIDGGAIVTWQKHLLEEEGNDIYARRYTSSRDASDIEFLVNTHKGYEQTVPAVAGLNDGGFLIVWQSNAPEYGGYASSTICIRRYLFDGEPISNELSISQTGIQSIYPDVACMADGGFTVVWNAQNSIFGQRFNALGEAVAVNITLENKSSKESNKDITGIIFGILFVVGSVCCLCTCCTLLRMCCENNGEQVSPQETPRTKKRNLEKKQEADQAWALSQRESLYRISQNDYLKNEPNQHDGLQQHSSLTFEEKFNNELEERYKQHNIEIERHRVSSRAFADLQREKLKDVQYYGSEHEIHQREHAVELAELEEQYYNNSML